MKDAAKENHESPATVLGLDNQPLASVTARLWPKLCCGGFGWGPGRWRAAGKSGRFNKRKAALR
jgi:hypothetical protein